MRRFTANQANGLMVAMQVYKLRCEGYGWQEIARRTHYALRTCYYKYQTAEKALNRFYGFDDHRSYD